MISETVIREVKEETGIDIKLTKFCGISQEMKSGICNFWWFGIAMNAETQTSSESLPFEFYDVKDALLLMKNEEEQFFLSF
ncbi:NUDIX hydrolase [Viridibacillus sp. FSL E2-0187]|uniref:NUDIX hydrolase n=1 Tax=Viridibacillus sp. FSL E2-0187 TaxID=2921362 RepID=UPI004047BF6C